MKHNNMLDLTIKTVIIVVTILTVKLNYASQTNQKPSKSDQIRAIVGEAGNQGQIGMQAVACGIKNRVEGLRGVFGVNNPIVDQQPRYVFKMAEDAYNWARNSKQGCYDLISGADMWENVKAFGNPNGWPPVIFVKTIGDHNFYRRIK